jgi:thiamine-phosphate diphosphorylase
MHFLDCGEKPLGIYPVVERAYKLETLFACGITTAQLRVKDLEGKILEEEVVKAITIAQKYSAKLFINDYWELAIKHKAYGVHLGQEDVQKANIEAIKRASIRLGMSTHTTDEIETAHAIKPSYVAIGPIYETTSKKMVYAPVGLSDLKRWAEGVNYPIVAIGGINLNNIDEVLATKTASGISMISGVLDNKGEIAIEKTKALVAKFKMRHHV